MSTHTHLVDSYFNNITLNNIDYQPYLVRTVGIPFKKKIIKNINITEDIIKLTKNDTIKILKSEVKHFDERCSNTFYVSDYVYVTLKSFCIIGNTINTYKAKNDINSDRNYEFLWSFDGVHEKHK